MRTHSTARARNSGFAPPSGRRRGASGGNVILESVFTILPVFAIICAFVDFGLLVFRWSTLENAVREGCRYAITFQQQSVNGVPQGQDASIEGVVQQYALGMVTASDSPRHIFVNYYAPTDLTTPIGTGGNIPGNVVEVSVQNVSWAWIAPLSGGYGAGIPFFRSTTPVTLSVYSSDLLGGYAAGVNSVPR